MTLRINTNIQAINTHRNMLGTDMRLSSSLEKLSSGLRINHASDDAAGLSIADRLLTQVNGLNVAQANAQQGITLFNVADGALDQIGSILQRVRELAVQSSNGTLTTSDRVAADAEVQSLLSEVDNIASFTTFNGFSLLNNGATTGAATTFTFQVGSQQNQTVVATIAGTCTGQLKLGIAPANTIDVSTQAHAQAALTSLDFAINQINVIRGGIGAASNRLQYEINNIGVSAQNLKAAESQIRDVDFASEMSTLTQNQILMQSATAMLAQANAQPQSVLSLFR